MDFAWCHDGAHPGLEEVLRVVEKAQGGGGDSDGGAEEGE